MNKHYIDFATFNAFKEGKRKATRKVFDAVYKGLVNFSFDIVKNQMEAEDIAIRSFTKLMNNAAGKETYNEFRAALYTTARNLSFNYYNRQMGKILSLDETSIPEPSEDTVSLWMLNADVTKTIEEELELLSPEDRKLAELLVFQQVKPIEVAEQLHMNVQTVRNKKSILNARFWKALKRKGLFILILF